MAAVVKLFFVCDDGTRYPIAEAGGRLYAFTGPHWINEVYGWRKGSKHGPHICLVDKVTRGKVRVQAKGRKT